MLGSIPSETHLYPGSLGNTRRTPGMTPILIVTLKHTLPPSSIGLTASAHSLTSFF